MGRLGIEKNCSHLIGALVGNNWLHRVDLMIFTDHFRNTVLKNAQNCKFLLSFRSKHVFFALISLSICILFQQTCVFD